MSQQRQNLVTKTNQFAKSAKLSDIGVLLGVDVHLLVEVAADKAAAHRREVDAKVAGVAIEHGPVVGDDVLDQWFAGVRWLLVVHRVGDHRSRSGRVRQISKQRLIIHQIELGEQDGSAHGRDIDGQRLQTHRDRLTSDAPLMQSYRGSVDQEDRVRLRRQQEASKQVQEDLVYCVANIFNRGHGHVEHGNGRFWPLLHCGEQLVECLRVEMQVGDLLVVLHLGFSSRCDAD